MGQKLLTMMMKITGPAKPQMTPFWTLSQQQPSAVYFPEADDSVMVTIKTGSPGERDGQKKENRASLSHWLRVTEDK